MYSGSKNKGFDHKKINLLHLHVLQKWQHMFLAFSFDKVNDGNNGQVFFIVPDM